VRDINQIKMKGTAGGLFPAYAWKVWLDFDPTGLDLIKV
jgi:hypothetical protein